MADRSLGALVVMAMDALNHYLNYRKLIETRCDDLDLMLFYVDCYERLAVPYLEELEDIRELVCGSVDSILK